jgi:hypothetical protein
MSPERLAQIRAYADNPNTQNSFARAYILELIGEVVAPRTPWPPPLAATAPDELFPRDHVLAQASPEFQLETAISLMQYYAAALTHTPNAQEVYTRVTAELQAGTAAAEIIALKHETEWTDDERRTMTRRKWLAAARSTASDTGAYTASARALAALGGPPR